VSARALVVSLALAAAGCATTPTDPRDPLEGVNRAVFAFNDQADEIVFQPAARLYQNVTPQGLRDAVRNFFNNIDDLFIGANNLLQGKVESALNDWMRFAFNTTFGLLGIHDWASDMGLEKHNEDFGQTLGRWGVGDGMYLVLPLLGPSTLRDTAALPVDWAGDPVFEGDRLPPELLELADRACVAAQDAFQAWADQDTARAAGVVRGDAEVDRLERVVCDAVHDRLQHAGGIESGLDTFRMARELERVGDHLCNLAEDVIYLSTGEIVRHNARS
jgi:ABC-type transporter lipoprotein component MlaA